MNTYLKRYVMKKLQFFIAAAGLLMSSFAPATESKGQTASGVIIFMVRLLKAPVQWTFRPMTSVPAVTAPDEKRAAEYPDYYP